MITLSPPQKLIKLKFIKVKSQAGTHSPSIETIKTLIPEIDIKIDACFLSNPFATDLVLKHFKKDFIDESRLREVLEYYPSQNEIIAQHISKAINIRPDSIFVGNGAVEIIQAVIHNFVKGKLVIILPTFSSYYEFVKEDLEVAYYTLDKQKDFALDLKDFSDFIIKEQTDSVVIINPNNPDGNYIKQGDLTSFIETHRNLKNIIIDESFIHFAIEDELMELKSVTSLVEQFENLIVIKSMSKDFGIAGIRSGFGAMHPSRVKSLLRSGYLWNSNGLSEWFFSVYSDKTFRDEYELIRKRYIHGTLEFLNSLKTIPNIKVYPSMANFALIELIDGTTAEDFVFKLLIEHGIYTRLGNDKKGLSGQFVRIASRTNEHNKEIVKAIRKIFQEASL